MEEEGLNVAWMLVSVSTDGSTSKEKLEKPL